MAESGLPDHSAMGSMGGVSMIASLHSQKTAEICVFSGSSLRSVKEFDSIMGCMRALLDTDVPTALFLLHASMLHGLAYLPWRNIALISACAAKPLYLTKGACNHLAAGASVRPLAALFKMLVYGGNTS